MVKVKICGITSYEDALAVAQAGADMLGLNFYKRSPRYVTVQSAADIAARLRDELGANCPLLIGLFVNEVVGRISITMEQVGFKMAQLSGDESLEMLKEMHGAGFKGIRPRNMKEALEDALYFTPAAPKDDRYPSLLLDAYHPDLYGGTGQQASIDVAKAIKEKTPRLMLAGGLKPDNVAEIVKAVQPWGVDVASGVETSGHSGKKDIEKVKAFIDAAKGAAG
ncbi:MAG: phosphoribosylanthranilate isomerase [Anaerolineae bacterium]|nr:phosphoribosylanthranilate isomerase [Anaerolineae bacterium]